MRAGREKDIQLSAVRLYSGRDEEGINDPPDYSAFC